MEMNRTIEQAAHLFRVHPDLQTSVVREQCQFLASYIGPMQVTSIRLDPSYPTKRAGLSRVWESQDVRVGYTPSELDCSVTAKSSYREAVTKLNGMATPVSVYVAISVI